MRIQRWWAGKTGFQLILLSPLSIDAALHHYVENTLYALPNIRLFAKRDFAIAAGYRFDWL
jgi:hypothetical protein